MNGKSYTLERLAILADALAHEPTSPVRDSAQAKVNEALDLTLANRSERGIMMTAAETALTTLAVGRLNGKAV